MKVKLEGLHETLRNLDEFSYALYRELKQVVGDNALEVKDRAVRRCPVDFGHLQQNIMVDFNERKLTAEIWARMPYASAVEFGTAPHFPRVDKIAGWAMRHHIDPWALAVSISRHGTRPHPFLFNSLEEVRGKFERELIEVIRRHTR